MGIYATELTDKHKAAIRMRDTERKTFEQIAFIFGCRRQTARTLYVRASSIQKRLERQNRTRSVDVNPLSAHGDGRAARLMGYDCDPVMPPEWQQGWVVADRFFNQRGVEA